MTVVVDSREPWERVIDQLNELGVDSKLEALNGSDDPDENHPYADYLVADRTCGVQRKEVNDFVSSLDSLKDELFELREAHEYSVLLIEGDWRTAGSRIALRRGKSLKQTVPIAAWHNFMLSQQLRGTVFVRTNSLSETCRSLVAMDGYLSRDAGPPVDTVSQPYMILQLLPGIGEVAAQRLVDEYGSVYGALMSVGVWDEDVEGIGPAKQQRVMEWFKNE